MNSCNLKEFLEEKYYLYCQPQFIESDPVQIPHLFTKKNDIEISAFLTAIISWGNRKSIIRSAKKLMALMDNSPFDFVMNAKESDLSSIYEFYHRTLNETDILYFIKALHEIYKNYNGLHDVFSEGYETGGIENALIHFRRIFFSWDHKKRTEKHISDVQNNSSAKRLNMFLRWMARRDKQNIDFGIWNNISMKDLYIPLDVHTGNVARKLGLLNRKQNNWEAVKELTASLKKIDPNDPVKYDYALFGLGIFEKF